jgi:hypothetical protein
MPINPPASGAQVAFSPDGLIAGQGDEILTEVVTLIAGQNLVRGAVLGQITASGKYNLSLTAAADGSQVAKRILAADCNAVADSPAVVYRKGTFNDSVLTYGAAHTAATVAVGLVPNGIFLEHGQPSL